MYTSLISRVSSPRGGLAQNRSSVKKLIHMQILTLGVSPQSVIAYISWLPRLGSFGEKTFKQIKVLRDVTLPREAVSTPFLKTFKQSLGIIGINGIEWI